MAYDAYLKIEGINNTEGTEAQIEIFSFALGPVHDSISDGTASGRSQHTDLNIVKHVDTTSPKLFVAAATGETFKTGVLNILPAVQNVGGVQTFLKYSFSDIVISALETTGNEHGDILPTEQISLKVRNVSISLTHGG